MFDRAEHRYFDHRRNFTWLTERRVELSLALEFVAESRPDQLLEVGAVLPQYAATGHTVVDRFEHGPGILNVDIAEFRPGRSFDRIVSVSTVEHVGWDEEPRRPDAALAALGSLVDLLSAGGAALVTVPAGYNRALDAALAAGDGHGFRWRGLVRVDRANRWREVEPAEALRRRYGEPFLAANGLLVGVAGAD